jgi:hypothetical protein
VNVLGQKTELQRAGARDFTAIGCFITSYEPKDGRLAGAVATDKSHVFARIYLQARATQHVLRAEGFVNVCETKQHLECCGLTQLLFISTSESGVKPHSKN